MAGAFLTANAIGRAAVLASPCAVPPGMPLSNLLDGQPRLRARFPLPFIDSAGGESGFDYSTGIALGLGVDKASRNLQLSSSNLAPGTGYYFHGPASVDAGAKSGISGAGNLTARRMGSSSATGADAYYANAQSIPVIGGRTYTFSAWVRRQSGTTTGTFCVVDETNGTTSTRAPGAQSLASLGIGTTFALVYRTITMRPDTTAVWVYWLSDYITGTQLDLDSPQVEPGSTPSQYIPTTTAPVSRDLIGMLVPVRVDLGAAVPVDCVAIIGSTLGAGARMRVRLATADTSGNVGDAWDSGLLTVPTGPDAAGNIIALRSSPAIGRYLLVEVYEAGATQIDLGRIVAGSLWRMTRSHSYGIEEGRLMLDRRERNPFTGAEFPVPAVANPRTARFTLPMLTTGEALGAHRTLLAQLGAAGDTLWIPATDLSPAELALRSLWGAAAAPGDVAAAAKHHRNLYSRSFNMVERL